MASSATPDRILLIKLRHHGDVLLTTPVVNALKTRFPAARIDMLVYRETVPVLSRNRDIHQILTLDRSLRGWKAVRHYLGLYRQLTRARYDWVIHLSDQWGGALIARLLKPAEAVGIDYPKRRNKYWQQSFTRLAPCAASDTRHAVEQNLMALEALGIEASERDRHCTMAVSQEDRDSVGRMLDSLGVHGDFIVVHPPARWVFKCWEDDRFAAVIQSLADDGWPVIVTGGPSDQELGQVGNIMQQVNSPRVHALAGQLSLNTLAALIGKARLFIGVDSVPMHMAAALQTDCIALFGPSKLNEWHPWMCNHILIKASDYTDDNIDPDAVETGTQTRYLSAIPVEAVLTATQHMLIPDEAGRRG